MMKIFDFFYTIQVAEDISLNEIIADDAQDILELYSDEKISTYLPDDCLIRSIQDAKNEILYLRNLFLNKQTIYWAIRFKTKLIGTIGFNYIDFRHQKASISCDLNVKYWSRGIMQKSVKAVLKFIFENTEINRIEADIAESNARSVKLFQKMGFKMEGIARDYKCYRKIFYNFFIYSLIRKDYLAFYDL